MNAPKASLPRGDEYVAALQHPAVAFRDLDLRRATIETRPNGLPRPYTGGFTMTFHAAGAGGEWAIRCFTRDVRELARRYDAIGRFSSTTSDRAFARAELIADEIAVGGRRYPVIKMEWVRGPQLNAYVDRHHGNSTAMRNLAQEMLAVADRLEAMGIAHGDLQHGNILVSSIGEMRLVDYDDLFLPELADLEFSSGLGHQNYQHPGRTSRDYGPHMDRFSLYSIYLSLLALAEDSALWEAYDGGDERLLFKREDYADPEGSRLFADLAKREPLSEWIDRFAAVCHGAYAAIPAPADFMAGRFAYARFVPGGPRPQPAPAPAPAPALPPPVVEAPPPPARPPREKPSPATRAAAAPARRNLLLPGAIVAALALAGIFHDALYRIVVPPPSAPPATATVPHPHPHPHPAATRPPAALHPPARAEHPRVASHHAAKAPPAAATPVARETEAPAPRRTPPAVAKKQAPPPVRAPHRAAAVAGAGSAVKPKSSHRPADASTALLNAAAGDVPGAPKCATPDAPARVLSVAIPLVSKYGNASARGGAADIAVTLTPSGEVSNASVAISSGSADLDAAAVDAAKRGRYAAASVNCNPVASNLEVHVRF